MYFSIPSLGTEIMVKPRSSIGVVIPLMFKLSAACAGTARAEKDRALRLRAVNRFIRKLRKRWSDSRGVVRTLGELF
jgi:hypothetical protein